MSTKSFFADPKDSSKKLYQVFCLAIGQYGISKHFHECTRVSYLHGLECLSSREQGKKSEEILLWHKQTIQLRQHTWINYRNQEKK